MRVSLIPTGGGELFLAGEAGVSERVHTSAADFQLSGTVAKQPVTTVRASHGHELDRGNLQHTLTFSTTRLFATAGEAALFCLDLGSNARTGTVRIDAVAPGGAVTSRYMRNAVVSPPARRVTGATVHLDYIITGGEIATTLS